MSARRTALTAVTAWLAVVAVGSALVWAVISRAGEDISSSAAPAVSVTPDPTPGATFSPRPSGSGSDSPGSPSPDSSGPGSSGSASPGGPTGSPSPQPSPSAAEPQRRTWQGTGGYVAVICRGPVAFLEAAQPDAGFRVEVDDSGPQEVRVEFEGSGEDEVKSEVRARCEGGVPVLRVDTDD